MTGTHSHTICFDSARHVPRKDPPRKTQVAAPALPTTTDALVANDGNHSHQSVVKVSDQALRQATRRAKARTATLASGVICKGLQHPQGLIPRFMCTVCRIMAFLYLASIDDGPRSISPSRGRSRVSTCARLQTERHFNATEHASSLGGARRLGRPLRRGCRGLGCDAR